MAHLIDDFILFTDILYDAQVDICQITDSIVDMPNAFDHWYESIAWLVICSTDLQDGTHAIRIR